MAPPDVTILYIAFRIIFSNVFIGAGSNLQLRWMSLENNFSLPQVVSLAKIQEVSQFVDGELSYLVIQGTKTGNPGLPLTDNQKRQEATKKEQDVKNKRQRQHSQVSHHRRARPQTKLHPGCPQQLPGGPSHAKIGHKESA